MAVSSCFHTLTVKLLVYEHNLVRVDDYLLVLSASPTINRSPVRSYVELIIPASASSEPG